MSIENTQKIDGVFEGGGVKGSAFAGAIAVVEEKGYKFENVAGTSAGSIVAALIAAGYTAAEIKKFMDELDYSKFRDETVIDKIPLAGKTINLLLTEGIYKGDYIENVLADLLAQKGIKTFKDFVIPEYADEPKYRYRMQAIASDLTNARIVVLPRDAKKYGLHPDDLSVAKAIRMSISIPFFFEPVKWIANNQESYIVDGGLLSQFPVWLLDDDAYNLDWPTFGFKLVNPDTGKPNKIDGPIKFLEAMFNTLTQAHDARYIEDHDFARTVPIQTGSINGNDFGITKQQKQWLYDSGREAAVKFFETWDWEAYKKKYLEKQNQTRTERVWNE